MASVRTPTARRHDANGNTATEVNSSGTTTFAWDFENRLSSVTLPGSGGTVSFAYDPFGRRIKKASNTGTSIYAYDGDNLIEETNSSGSAVARYSDGLNIDEPLAMLHSSTTSYYEADGLGTITSLSSGAGALAQTYTFDSFGKQTASSGSLTNPFQYTARESDPETGLYYYRARYYDPTSGRFTREDPTREVLRGLNFYEYVRNNSPNFVDPNGRGPGQWVLNTLELIHKTKEKVDKGLEWTFCGLYAVTCTDSGVNLRYDISQATAVGTTTEAYINSTEALAQSTHSNSMSDMNRKVCLVNQPCANFMEHCTKFATPNPF